jgi:hypothetical protein
MHKPAGTVDMMRHADCVARPCMPLKGGESGGGGGGGGITEWSIIFSLLQCRQQQPFWHAERRLSEQFAAADIGAAEQYKPVWDLPLCMVGGAPYFLVVCWGASGLHSLHTKSLYAIASIAGTGIGQHLG